MVCYWDLVFSAFLENVFFLPKSSSSHYKLLDPQHGNKKSWFSCLISQSSHFIIMQCLNNGVRTWTSGLITEIENTPKHFIQMAKFWYLTMSFLQLLVVRRKMMKLKESDIGVGFLKIQWSDCRGKKKKWFWMRWKLLMWTFFLK